MASAGVKLGRGISLTPLARLGELYPGVSPASPPGSREEEVTILLCCLNRELPCCIHWYTVLTKADNNFPPSVL